MNSTDDISIERLCQDIQDWQGYLVITSQCEFKIGQLVWMRDGLEQPVIVIETATREDYYRQLEFVKQSHPSWILDPSRIDTHQYNYKAKAE
jgi:hypothetical protein